MRPLITTVINGKDAGGDYHRVQRIYRLPNHRGLSVVSSDQMMLYSIPEDGLVEVAEIWWPPHSRGADDWRIRSDGSALGFQQGVRAYVHEDEVPELLSQLSERGIPLR